MPLAPRVPLLFLGATGWLLGCAASAPPALEPAQDCSGAPWVQEQLFFGLTRRDGSEVSDADWGRFVDSVLTPRFPEGLTTLEASGQWRMQGGAAAGTIVRERSRVVLLLHPHCAEQERAVQAVMAEYERRFDQEAVLRVVDPVTASF